MKRTQQSSIFTQSVHAGEDRVKYANAITMPIVETSTFVFSSSDEIKRYTSKKLTRFEYGRYGNPTQKAAESKLAALEGAEDCLLFDCGMSAVTSTLFALLSQGDHIILTDDAYGQTLNFCKKHLPRLGVASSIVKMGDYPALQAAIQPNTKVIFTESPTNPYLNVVDMDRMQRIRKKFNGLMVVDSTFATPFNQRPLEWDMDLVIHSTTKYLAGHNDVLGGAVLGGRELVNRVREYQRVTGGIMDPLSCYLLIRGLKTFALRVQYQNRSTLKIAKFLEGHPKIEKVFYPGLSSHPHHSFAKKQMKGFGGVVSFYVKGNLTQVNRFLDSLKSIYIGPTLGGPESLITHPATVTYYRYTRDERYKLGITDQLCRLAVGIEDVDDLIADLDQALKKIK